jgi:hypothetical protein
MRTILSRALAAVTVAVAIVATAAPASAQTYAATRWAPLDAGNTWSYREQGGTETREIKVLQTYGAYRYVAGIFGARQELWFGYHAAPSYANNLFVWNGDAQAWYYGFRFGVTSTSTRWGFKHGDGGCSEYTAGWKASGTTITTAAGTFRGCRQVGLEFRPAANVRCASAPDASYWFAPEVGIVRIVTAAGKTYDLETAIVGSKVYPIPAPAPALSAICSIDKRVYENVLRTVYCIRAPCPPVPEPATAQVSYTITNASSSTKTFQFSSGKQLDVEIFDPTGKVVKAWSDDRMFTQALTQFSLAPGASKTFTADVALLGRDGKLLDGTYTARAFLATASWSAQTAPDARAPLSCTVVNR